MTEKSVFCHLPRLCSAVWRWVGHCSAGWLACHFLWTFRTAWKIFIIRPKCRQGGSAVWQGVRGRGLCHHLLSDVLVTWGQVSRCYNPRGDNTLSLIESVMGLSLVWGCEGRQIQCDDHCCQHHTLGERRKTRGCYGLVQLMMPTYWVIIADTFPVELETKLRKDWSFTFTEQRSTEKALICSVLNVKVLVCNFNVEKAQVGAFSVVVKLQTSRRFVSSSTSQPSSAATFHLLRDWRLCFIFCPRQF